MNIIQCVLLFCIILIFSLANECEGIIIDIDTEPNNSTEFIQHEQKQYNDNKYNTSNANKFVHPCLSNSDCILTLEFCNTKRNTCSVSLTGVILTTIVVSLFCAAWTWSCQ